MSEQPACEFDRQRRVLDQMLSAHSLLAERYERRDGALVLTTLGLSVVAAGVAFISSAQRVEIGPFTARVQVWVGVLTCVIFFLSIVELRVEWARRAWAHGEASRRLADLKAKYRHGSRVGAVVRSDIDLTAEYERTMDAIGALQVPIKDGQFNKLKARHRRKVEISKRISLRPERPVLLHRLDLLREGMAGPAGGGREGTDAETGGRLGR
jgi:hypothetical protein